MLRGEHVEIIMKAGLGRSDFTVCAVAPRRSFLINNYRELAVAACMRWRSLNSTIRRVTHLIASIDHLLVVQATAEGYLLATVDTQLIGLQGVLDLRYVRSRTIGCRWLQRVSLQC